MPHDHQPGLPATAPADPVAADLDPAQPEATDASADTDALDSPIAQADLAVATSGRNSPVTVLILGAVAVLLGAFGIWATVQASSLRTQSTQRNTALIDPAATSVVRAQMDSAVQTIFSYSYANTGVTRQAAQQLLTGAAIQQYNSLFALVQQQAPAEKLVVTTTVTNSGVELLTGDQARVLIFVNQQDTRAGTSQTSYGGAMLAVTAVFQAGRWKIENIDTFT